MKVEEFLEKYNEIWEKVSNMIKEINSELLEKIPKSWEKSYKEKINTKTGSQYMIYQWYWLLQFI